MASRLDKIIDQAYDYLNFYHDNKYPVARNKKEDIIIRPCAHSGCRTNVVVSNGETLCEKHKSPKKKLLGDIKEAVTPEKQMKTENSVDNPVPQEVKPTVVLSDKDIQLNIMKARDIIDLVKNLTGHEITICIKSKINIIRHAKIHLEKAGYKIV